MNRDLMDGANDRMRAAARAVGAAQAKLDAVPRWRVLAHFRAANELDAAYAEYLNAADEQDAAFYSLYGTKP